MGQIVAMEYSRVAYTLETFWYQLEISTMIGSKVMTNNVFSMFVLTLTFVSDITGQDGNYTQLHVIW
jgi:hypothetical protein